MSEYVPKATKLIEAAGGKVLARGGKTVGDSAPKGRVILIAYDSLEKVESMAASPEWQKISKIGEKYAKFNVFAVEGVE
jgi:uncharacterized protein (DUF1330 family)